VILLFIIAASAIGLVVAYGGTTPSVMGHSWGRCAVLQNPTGLSSQAKDYVVFYISVLTNIN
jgi:hypothetical protein